MSGRACQSREVHSAPVERQNPVRLGIRLVGKQETVGAAWNVVSRTDPRESPAGVRIASGPRSGKPRPSPAARRLPAPTQHTTTPRPGPPILGTACPCLAGMAGDPRLRTPGHRGSLAPLGVAAVLDLEEPQTRAGRPRIDRVLRELILQMESPASSWLAPWAVLQIPYPSGTDSSPAGGLAATAAATVVTPHVSHTSRIQQ